MRDQDETQQIARKTDRGSAERTQSRQQENVGNRSIDSGSLSDGHGNHRAGLGGSGIHAGQPGNLGNSMDHPSGLANSGNRRTHSNSGSFRKQPEKVSISENLVPMLMLYMWSGLEFARDEVVSSMKSGGSEAEDINEFFSEVFLVWRNQIIATYIAIGLIFTLIRKFMENDSSVGLFFSLGGAFFIFLAIMAVKRFYQRPRKTSSFI